MSQDPYPREHPTGPGPSYDDGGAGFREAGPAHPPAVPPRTYQEYRGHEEHQEYRGYRPYAGSYPFAPQTSEGEKAAQLSLVLGITGFFVAGLILGPLAIWQARRAESLGVPATAGKVLGWILTVLWGSVLLALVGLVMFLFAGLATVGRFGG